MKEINSLFKKPEQYIVTAILSLGSFTACFYGLTEHGFVSGEFRSIWVFRAIVFVVIIIPALFPFHHLLVSGRNRPVHLVYPLLALALLVVTFGFPCDLLLKHEWVALVPCAIWLLLLCSYYTAGISFKNSANKEVWIKENVFVEVLIIGLLLALMFVLGIGRLFSLKWVIRNPNIVESPVELDARYFEHAFCHKDHAYALKLKINDRIFKNKILETNYETNRQAFFETAGEPLRGEMDLMAVEKKALDSILATRPTSYDKIDIDSAIMPKLGEIHHTSLGELSKRDTSHRFNQAYLNAFVRHRVHHRSIFLLQMQFMEEQQEFAESFEEIVKRYQAVGTILLALTGLVLLGLLISELGHSEYRNRLRTQLFLILALMIPLNRDIRKEDITIERPFGNTVFNRSNASVHWITPGPNIDTTGLAQQVNLKDLPRHIDTIMTSLLNDINYVNYVLSINDIKTHQIDSQYIRKPAALKRSKPRP